MTQQTNLALKKLQGITPKGIKANQDSLASKRLIDLGSKEVKKYSSFVDVGVFQRAMYRDVEKELRDFEFGKEELDQFIRCGIINSFEGNESKVFGTYSGCLLELLCKRADLRGDRFNFYIDGENNKFDYLFFEANVVHDLIIENFTGHNLCSEIASGEGRAGNISIVNCAGDNAGATIARHKGVVNSINIINHKGECILFNAGIICDMINKINIFNSSGYLMGDRLGSTKGNIKRIRFVNNEGDASLHHLGYFTESINSVCLIQNKGKFSFGARGSNSKYDVNSMLVHNCDVEFKKNFKPKKLITDVFAENDYNYLCNQFKFFMLRDYVIESRKEQVDLIQYVDSFKDKSYKEIEPYFNCMRNAFSSLEKLINERPKQIWE